MPFIKNTVLLVKREYTPVQPPVIGKIDAGDFFSINLKNSGQVWAWGANASAQIGDNSTTQRNTPVSIAGATKTFCNITGGDAFSAGIDKNGKVWSWGQNSAGQLGDNSITQRNTPVSLVGTTKTFCSIAAGQTFTIGLDKNGRIWGWGRNAQGELAQFNLTTSYLTPVSICGATKTFCKISANLSHAHGLDKNGKVWSWGLVDYWQAGDAGFGSRCTPVGVLGPGATKTFCEIAAGQFHTLAIEKNGQVWAWASNTYGELGINNATAQRTPVTISGATKTFCKISAGMYFSIAIDKNGRAWAWGLNTNGQLGDNSATSRLTPVSVLGAVKTFIEVSTGKNHTIAIDKDNKVWAWGDNTSGQLGAKYTILGHNTPVSIVTTAKTFCKISVAANSTGNDGHIAAITNNGFVWTWGRRNSGQLGTNLANCNPLYTNTPLSIVGTTKTFCNIAANGQFTIGIDKNGRLWSWGLNTNGQLGDNSVNSKLTPVSVLGAVKTFCAIAVGTQTNGTGHSLAIDKNGRAWGWGLATNGRIGDNTTTQRNTPVSVLGAIKTFCKIQASAFHSVAIDKNGGVWCWGNNPAGQLGDNTTLSKRTPVAIVGATKTFCEISTKREHTIAIDKNGKIWGWGTNTVGQLGDNSATNRCTPVAIAGATKTFCKVAAGANFSIAIDKNGQVWGWGLNTNGQLGENLTASSFRTPVSIRGANKTFCEISAGQVNAFAIDKNGQVWGWGLNAQNTSDSNQMLAQDYKVYAFTPIKIQTL